MRRRALDSQRLESVVCFADPQTGLEVRCVAVSYRDFPTVEWTVYFKNNGMGDTPIIAGIQALDARWEREGEGEFLLHHEFGTFWPHTPNDFIPQESLLGPGQARRFIPARGRACADVMPYFDLERGGHSGVIVVVGWPGAWVASFARDKATGIRVTAGQEITHLRLHPGEEIRTPLVVLQFWRGDWIQAQNTWRRWMFAHNMPRPGGRQVQPTLAPSSGAQFDNMVQANEASQLLFIDRYREEKLPIDYWWMDAGWYRNNGRWQEPIEWKADPARFPRGLRGVTDYAHQSGNQEHRLVRTGAGDAQQRALAAAPGLAAAQPHFQDAFPTALSWQSGGPGLAHRPDQRDHHPGRNRRVPPGFQHRRTVRDLAQQ